MTEFKKKGKDYLDMESFLTRAEAVSMLRENWHCRPGTEEIALSEALGRTSAQDGFSLFTLPVVRASGPDGIAVRFADFEQGVPDTSAWKEGVDYVAADCGDDFDDAFDTVINIERVSFDADRTIHLHLDEKIEKGQMVRERGASLREGEQVVAAGMKLHPLHLGLLANAGIEQLSVLKRPKVAFLPTGNELIPRGAVPERGQNIQSNGLMIEAFLNSWQGEMWEFPITSDHKASIEKTLDTALAGSDIVLLSGGSSMGSEDFVSGLLKKRASICQHGVRCIPGMPMAVGIVDGKPVINMPGPPFAAYCAMDWCVKELLAHWYGLPVPCRQKVSVILDKEITKPERMEFYARLHLFTASDGSLHADPIRMADRFAEGTCRFNGLHIMPIGCATYEAGQEIEAEILHTDLFS